MHHICAQQPTALQRDARPPILDTGDGRRERDKKRHRSRFDSVYDSTHQLLPHATQLMAMLRGLCPFPVIAVAQRERGPLSVEAYRAPCTKPLSVELEQLSSLASSFRPARRIFQTKKDTTSSLLLPLVQ
jgi:hypothetical protein